MIKPRLFKTNIKYIFSPRIQMKHLKIDPHAKLIKKLGRLGPKWIKCFIHFLTWTQPFCLPCLLKWPFQNYKIEFGPKNMHTTVRRFRGFESLQGFSGFAVVKIGFGSSSLLLQLLVVQMHNVRAVFLSDSHSNI